MLGDAWETGGAPLGSASEKEDPVFEPDDDEEYHRTGAGEGVVFYDAGEEQNEDQMRSTLKKSFYSNAPGGGISTQSTFAGSSTQVVLSPRRGQPESLASWEHETKKSMDLAKSLMKKAKLQMKDNENFVLKTERKTDHGGAHITSKLKVKIGNTQDLIKGLEDRIDSIEDTARQTRENLFQLKRAYRAKWSPLNVCERRLELRDSRPLQELVQDPLQETLEEERQTIVESRQELQDQIQSTKAMVNSLEEMKAHLMEDLRHKRHALRIDRCCLHPSRVQDSEGDNFFLPALAEVPNYSLPPSPKGEKRGTGVTHEDNRLQNTKLLITRAVRLEEKAMRLANENDSAMLNTKRECDRSSAATQAALSRRIHETGELRLQLEASLMETEKTIEATERSLHKTKKQLDANEAPLNQLNSQFKLRDGRTKRESIRDPVTDGMEVQLEGLKQAVTTLTDKFKATKDVLDSLKSTREVMAEDLRCKNIAQKIDDACSKVTAKKAIELDRMDPRGGRVHPANTPRKGGNAWRGGAEVS